MKIINKIAGALDKLLECLSVIMILFVFVVIVVQVVVRKLGGTMSWADEVCRYLTLIMIFFGAARSARLGDTIRVGVVLDKLSKNVRKWVEVIMQAIIAAFMGLFTYSLYLGILTLGDQRLGILTNVRLSTIYWVIFGTMVLLVINTLLHMIDVLKNGLPDDDNIVSGVFDEYSPEESEAGKK